MADLPWMIVLFCFAGPRLSAVSPALRSPLVITVGQNASLPCNLTTNTEITWYRLRSEQLELLLTVKLNTMNETTVDFPMQKGHMESQEGHMESQEGHMESQEGHMESQGDLLSGPVSLVIQGVNQADAGLYFCAGRCQGVVCFGRGIHLTVGAGEGEESDRRNPPCWSLMICLVPASVVLCLLCILGYCLHSGKRRVCCCRCVKRDGGLQEAGIQYASVRFADRPRPSAQGETGLVKEDVMYSTVARSNNPEA